MVCDCEGWFNAELRRNYRMNLSSHNQFATKTMPKSVYNAKHLNIKSGQQLLCTIFFGICQLLTARITQFMQGNQIRCMIVAGTKCFNHFSPQLLSRGFLPTDKRGNGKLLLLTLGSIMVNMAPPLSPRNQLLSCNTYHYQITICYLGLVLSCTNHEGGVQTFHS